ncbi:MAG: hypothetical protein HZC37_10740 [Burkholderiales bacterium]|nr:hypothetical protein [Burkholderiales bacterium]
MAALAGLMPAWAAAQFNMVPPPQCPPLAPAASTTADAYRVEAARHVYECFPGRVYLGVLPPLVYGVITVEAEIDQRGLVTSVNVVRKPAAEEVEPWMLALLRRAAPFPVPAKVPGGVVRFVETFFVDRSGLFQTHSLTEGQKGVPPVEVASPLTTTPP